jgi:PAS domain S-box-containing protein
MPKTITVSDELGAALEALSRRQGAGVEDTAQALLHAQLELVGATSRPVLDAPHAAIRLHLAEETLGAIVDTVITIDRHGHIEYMNPAAEDLTGYQLDDVRGKPIGSVLQISAPDADWLTNQLVQTCLQEGMRAEVQDDARLHTASGREVPIDGVASPLHNQSGNIVGAALVMHDITARKRAEAALTTQRNNLEALVERRTADLKALQDELLKKERLAALGHLTATVSHEIRNPLGTIRNSTHVLKLRVQSQVDGVDGLFERIDRNIERCKIGRAHV